MGSSNGTAADRAQHVLLPKERNTEKTFVASGLTNLFRKFEQGVRRGSRELRPL
jgi:hypothetical protein